MKRRTYPNPVLDPREEALLDALQREFQAFTQPGFLQRGLEKVTRTVAKLIPGAWKREVTGVKSSVGEWDLIQKTLQIAEQGFHLLTQQASRMTVSKPGVVAKLSTGGSTISTFEEVCLLRSYDIEAVIEDNTYKDLFLAAIQGAGTGFFGLPAVPFNLALSFFLYFRATQSIALHYGYDVKHDPRELQFAAEVTMQSLDPNFSGSGLGGLIGKMMLAAQLSGLRKSLRKMTYTAMARRGGSELLYVEIRALANKAAERALAKAGQEGIEAGVFKSLVAQMGARMPKEAGKKGIPILGALVGGLSDAYLMSRILRGAKLIYHKRFLFEKKHRIDLLKRSRAKRKRTGSASDSGSTPRSSARRKPKAGTSSE